VALAHDAALAQLPVWLEDFLSCTIPDLSVSKLPAVNPCSSLNWAEIEWIQNNGAAKKSDVNRLSEIILQAFTMSRLLPCNFFLYLVTFIGTKCNLCVHIWEAESYELFYL
jgi:hypothetical protein